MKSLPQRTAAKILAEYVQNGRARPGDRLPTVRELEVRYGVSRTTLSHALGLLAAQGHVVRRAGSGCYVAENAGKAAPGSPPLLGYVAPSQNWELFTAVYEGIQRVCVKRGRHLMVANAEYSYDSEREQVARMIAAGCEALVIVPASRTEEQLANDYLRREFLDFPIVLVDIASQEHQRRPCVLFDNYRLGCEYTERLLAEGHRYIAFMDIAGLDEPLMHFSTRERRRGFEDTLRTAAGNGSCQGRIWTLRDPRVGRDMSESYLLFLDELDAGEHPVTAVIALEDLQAAGFIEAARARGIRVPEDLRVVGFDNLAATSHFRPFFPTTLPDFRRAGELAATLAFQYAEGALKDPVVYMLPVPILWRGGKWERNAGKANVGIHVRNEGNTI